MYASASTARLKAARRLTKRALRQQERAFLAEGPQAVSEALATGARVSGLFVTAPAQARHGDLVAKAEDAGIDVQLVSGEVMSELAQTVTPQGLLAVCDFVDVPLDRVTEARPTLVALLANVRDPGNAGTALKGAGLRVLAADGRGSSTLDDPRTRAALNSPTAWLLGNEAWGLPDDLLALADESVAVPIYGRAESLNLASAAAVCLYASAAAQRAGPRPAAARPVGPS